MGNLFSPKVQQPKPTAGERNAATSADAERLDAVKKQAEARTAQLLRMFGSRSGLGFGNAGF